MTSPATFSAVAEPRPQTGAGSVAVGTIVAKNYLAYARVLAASLRRFHPQTPFFVLLADEVEGCFAPEEEPFNLLLLQDLAIPDLDRFRFAHSLPQVVTAAKPFLLSALLKRGFERVIFLDADILVLSSLDSLFEAVGRRSVSLTPHLLAPLTGAERAARELQILLSGCYNAGFLAVSAEPEAERFLAWWQERLYRHCDHDVAHGLLYDQRWLDLAPVYFPDLQVLRDPGLNVGYWCLPERGVSLAGEQLLVDGEPCRFFHFSGFDPERPQTVTRHAPRLTPGDLGAAAGLLERYRQLLLAAGAPQCHAFPYAYGRFDNGVPIPPVVRRIYHQLGDAVQRFGPPHQAAAPAGFCRWLNQPLSEGGITRLWRQIYRQRPDLQRAFPDPLEADRERFRDWVERYGLKEYHIPDFFALKRPQIGAP